MVSRRSTACTCTRSLYLLPSLLFLHSILHSSSYAQVAGPINTSPSTSTLQTSTGSPSSLTSTSNSPSSTQQQQNNNAYSTPPDGNGTNGRTSPGMFNYYFIIVAIIIILIILAMLYYGKRKKQKAALMRSNSQRALAEDVEGLRNRFGMGRGAMRRAHHGVAGGAGDERQRNELRAEGLDERGEAPPPYNAGSKPPSLRSGEGVDVRQFERGTGHVVEMSGLPSARQDPPGYGQETGVNGSGSGSWSELDMARPGPVVMAPLRRDGTTD
ncbi:uncharacterized protein RAG0_09823 [Rhynchosporium agropyri]|uniref:Uncharacterized protein n=1 Tax=Rhynchosporium agropyri TaxID=914238 RepID=A0A1E1KX70_9HELO|nr:uncharacterized protein RAG0_09823 [Rhynchosporium agropyri]